MSKYGRKQEAEPEGWDVVEPTLTALQNELRDKVNEGHEGMRRVESAWPVHQINWQTSRYIYDLYYTYEHISRDVYMYCIDNKLVDAALIAKWKKPGYERLCSTYAINTKNSKYGTVSICRVPRGGKHNNGASTLEGSVENQTTGCLGCASGPTTRNIFGNKYGQYLAQIQVARADRERALAQADAEAEEDGGDSPGGYSSKSGSGAVWAADEWEAEEAANSAFGGAVPPPPAASAGSAGSAVPGKRESGGAGKYQPPGKRSRTAK